MKVKERGKPNISNKKNNTSMCKKSGQEGKKRENEFLKAVKKVKSENMTKKEIVLKDKKEGI